MTAGRGNFDANKCLLVLIQNRQYKFIVRKTFEVRKLSSEMVIQGSSLIRLAFETQPRYDGPGDLRVKS